MPQTKPLRHSLPEPGGISYALAREVASNCLACSFAISYRLGHQNHRTPPDNDWPTPPPQRQHCKQKTVCRCHPWHKFPSHLHQSPPSDLTFLPAPPISPLPQHVPFLAPHAELKAHPVQCARKKHARRVRPSRVARLRGHAGKHGRSALGGRVLGLGLWTRPLVPLLEGHAPHLRALQVCRVLRERV